MKTLVAFFSAEAGRTKRVAEELAKKLEEIYLRSYRKSHIQKLISAT